ncbi:MAG TPA: methylated-DNA--[protein]-cysteine S-methyltransferase [Terriglobia bacterium]|nr:methylated-DNA--[protein]-cysteine S-methyltransferase [Terriglobia bacterium]
MQTKAEDYRRIEKAIEFLAENYHQQPSLDEVARRVNLSEFHFQRLFRRWAGISPKRLVQFLTLEHAKQALEESHSVLDAAYDAGLSSPSRLHDLFVTTEAMTPGEFKAKGAGLEISYGFHASPFGECLLAVTERGICGLGFVGEGGRRQALEDFKRRWPAARFQENPEKTRSYIQGIFNAKKRNGAPAVKLLLMGTNFQIKVWEALLRIPSGSVVCYEDLARRLGKPSAARAVGSAVGRNPISFLIPCHRAIRKMGITGDYHWGAARKKAILAWEAARQSSRTSRSDDGYSETMKMP